MLFCFFYVIFFFKKTYLTPSKPPPNQGSEFCIQMVQNQLSEQGTPTKGSCSLFPREIKSSYKPLPGAMTAMRHHHHHHHHHHHLTVKTIVNKDCVSFIHCCLTWLGLPSKMPQNGWLKEWRRISHSSVGQLSKTKVVANSVFGGTFLDLKTADFFLCAHIARRERDRDRDKEMAGQGESERGSALASLLIGALNL